MAAPAGVNAQFCVPYPVYRFNASNNNEGMCLFMCFGVFVFTETVLAYGVVRCAGLCIRYACCF